MAQLAPGGVLHPHVHSFEEGFYILSGQAVVVINEESYLMGAGDYGRVKVGTPHGGVPPAMLRCGGCRWARPSQASRRRARHLLPQGPAAAVGAAARSGDLRGSLLGHFDASQVPPVPERQNVLKGLEGVFLNWLIDEKFGAAHHRLLFIDDQPGVSIGLHDHTFEEGYFIVSGEVEATMDGKKYGPPRRCAVDRGVRPRSSPTSAASR